MNNARGTTGMDPMGVLVRLDEARHAHPLARRNGEPAVRALVMGSLQEFGFARLPEEELLGLSRFARRGVEPMTALVAVHSLAS